MTCIGTLRLAIAQYAQALDTVSLSSQSLAQTEREAQLRQAEEQAHELERGADFQLAAGVVSSAASLTSSVSGMVAQAHAESVRASESARLAMGDADSPAKAALVAARDAAQKAADSTKAWGDVIAAGIRSGASPLEHRASCAQADAKRAETRSAMHASLASEAKDDAARAERQADRWMSSLEQLDRARQQSLLTAARGR